MFVKFYHHPVEKGTGPDGLPLFVDEVWVTISRDSTHTMNRRANEEHFTKFRGLYESFLKATEGYEELEGYPLEMWAALRPSQVESFKIRGIRTVQDLSSVSQANLKKMPPEFKEIQAKARRFVELAGAGSGLTSKADELSAENESLREELADTKKLLRAFQEKLTEED